MHLVQIQTDAVFCLHCVLLMQSTAVAWKQTAKMMWITWNCTGLHAAYFLQDSSVRQVVTSIEKVDFTTVTWYCYSRDIIIWINSVADAKKQYSATSVTKNRALLYKNYLWTKEKQETKANQLWEFQSVLVWNVVLLLLILIFQLWFWHSWILVSISLAETVNRIYSEVSKFVPAVSLPLWYNLVIYVVCLPLFTPHCHVHSSLN